MNQKQIESIVKETLRNLGFTPDNPHQVQRDMIYLRKIRISQENNAQRLKYTTIGAIIPTLLFTLWQGVKTLLKGE